MTSFSLSYSNKVLDLSTPKVMGILNIHPGSFSAVGRFVKPVCAIQHARQMVLDGAAIIDVGAEPTNPGLHPCVSLQEELDRLIPVIELLAQEISVPISVDTSKAEVMREVIRAGAVMINDVRGLREADALSTVAALQVPVCLMHMAFPHGKPPNIASISTQDIVNTVKDFLLERVSACLAAGIAQENIIIDPGIGHGNFGKDLSQNLALLGRLSEFTTLGYPLLVGISRKTFLGELLDLPPEERLPGSLAATSWIVTQGAHIIRTHDVRETVQAMKVILAITKPQ